MPAIMDEGEPKNPEAAALLAELDLDVPGVTGHPSCPAPPRGEYFVAYSRDLTEADVAMSRASRGEGKPLRPLARIHASHHSLARCLAAGMKQGQAALVTGYTTVRIQQLERDPSFTALVEDYRAEVKSIFADLAERMNDLSLDAIEILQERLHSSPELFTVPVLLEVVKTFADRTGHGPGQEVNLRVSQDLIDRPPRENFDEWRARRDRELGGPPAADPKKLN